MIFLVSETLAGRAIYVNLWPLTRGERRGLGTPGVWTELLATPAREWLELVHSRDAFPCDWRDDVRAGGYPAAMRLDADSRSLWFDGNMRTYLERDLQQLAAIHNLVDSQRLVRAASFSGRGMGVLRVAESGADGHPP